MSECAATRPAPLRCPTLDEMLDAALALLPRGRAWQSNEGGPIEGIEAQFAPGDFTDEFAINSRRGSVLRQFWKSVAEVFRFASQRWCDLRLEFFCATRVETDDLWMAEYGLPDACDPFPELCAKVAAIGGTRCEYYAAVAARAGWSIECLETNTCGSSAGFALCGFSTPGRQMVESRLWVIVNRAESPAYIASGLGRSLPMAGRMLCGRQLSCVFDPLRNEIQSLECIMSRVVHAEIEIIYEAR